MFLSGEDFRHHVQNKYKQEFDVIGTDGDFDSLFEQVDEFVDTKIYVQLLSFLDMMDFDNFQRFFTVCVRRFLNWDVQSLEIDIIKGDIFLQLLCIICLQYYFL